MALPSSDCNREYNKFVETADGDVAVRVIDASNFSPPANTDAITVNRPDNVTDEWQFRTGGLAGTILKTVTIVYTDSCKEEVSTVAVS